jgi:hypothetical protein
VGLSGQKNWGHKQSQSQVWSVGLVTGGASSLSQVGGLVQFWKLSPGGKNLVPV